MSLVRHGFVFAGLIITKFFGAAIGISAFATAELYGPIMPIKALSSSICRTLATPASALYEPWRQSSKLWYTILKPSTPPAAFFWSTANFTPLEVDWPPVVQTGKSEPILIVPLLPLVPGLLPPQANATISAIERTTSPLARTIGSPLCWLGGKCATPHLTPPITCRPLPNSCRGESAPAANAATWDGRTATPRHTIDSEGPRSQVALDFSRGAPSSIRKPGAVVDRVNQPPRRPGIGANGLENRDGAVGRVPGRIEA